MMISTMLEVGQTYSLIPLRECYFKISLDRCDFDHGFCKTLRQVLGRNSTSDMPPLRAFLLRECQDVRMRVGANLPLCMLKQAEECASLADFGD